MEDDKKVETTEEVVEPVIETDPIEEPKPEQTEEVA